MIYNPRGTSGSGKTFLTRAIMAVAEKFGSVEKHYVPRRKQPYFYTFGLEDAPGRAPLRVLGHYENTCGGCDTIKTQDEVFDLVRQGHALGHDVIFEGLLVSGECNRTIALHHELVSGGSSPIRVLLLQEPLAACLAAVQSRRDARGDERPLNPKLTVDKHRAMLSVHRRLTEGGVWNRLSNREDAANYFRASGWVA